MKTILLTGATDGIGFDTAKNLVLEGCTLILHGRSEEKLIRAREALVKNNDDAVVDTLKADLSRLSEVSDMASTVLEKYSKLDVLINNAGVFKTPKPIMEGKYDIRFIVNTIAPYILTTKLLPLLDNGGRVINLCSAAQSPVDLEALAGKRALTDNEAYAQSKLGLLMWSIQLAQLLPKGGPSVIPLNPASFLASKMVKDAYGSGEKDLSVGVDVLFRAVFSEEFAMASGRYFDNDIGQWSPPHPDAQDKTKNEKLIATIIDVASSLGARGV